jgi:2-polyprenyl-3-methyl-5-hydroxy-6-metoxy-1,4-benzoquinol methylase
MKKLTDKKIIDSWITNAIPWVTAVRNGEIESRRLITNKAIINTIIKLKPKTVLDIGCGEGWLIRELDKAGIKSLGIDVVPELLEFAQKEGGGRFKSLSFEELSYTSIGEKFDLIICNFSLLGDESVIHIFRHVASLLNKKGSFVIQTIHPVTGCGNEEYKDGWREGSWLGFSNKFSDPAPWYFRTLENWETLFVDNGFKFRLLEPVNPKTKLAASVIFVAQTVSNT